MKKHILKLGFALAVVVAAGYTVYSSQTSLKMTGIALNNVEALASGENGGDCKWDREKDDHGCVYHVCVNNGTGYECSCGEVDD